MNIISTNKYLGSLCKRGHDWNSTGKSLRYKTSRECIECNKEYQQSEKHKEARRKYEQSEKVKEVKRNYYQGNKEIISKKQRKYRQKNREKLNQNAAKYYHENKEKAKQYYQGNKEKQIKYSMEYYNKNKDKINKHKRLYLQSKTGKEYLKKYREKNRNKLNEKIRKYRNNNKKYKLNANISRRINQSLKGNKNHKHWESLVGYTIKQLIKHLKKTIPDGYIFDDITNGKLHIDHIIPISLFTFDSPDDLQFKICWSLENLQLLPAKENIQKKNKLIKDFQLILNI